MLNEDDNGDSLSAAHGIAIGMLFSSALWLLIVLGIVLWYRYGG